MGAPFSDITLYIPTPYSNDTPHYWEETSLKNFVSDLYMQKMHGYKPPKATRVCIQPGFFGIWERTWKTGSIMAIAVEFIRDKYESLDRLGKCHYLLDIIQVAMLQLSEEYGWDKSVFEKAYQEVLDCNFMFKIDYPPKKSGDRKRTGLISIEKSDTITSVYAVVDDGRNSFKAKLFEKKNVWWYDCAYILAKHSKWRDANSFGIFYPKGKLDIYYSVNDDTIHLHQSGREVQAIDFKSVFWLG